jgi:hypothetical protein
MLALSQAMTGKRMLLQPTMEGEKQADQSNVEISIVPNGEEGKHEVTGKLTGTYKIDKDGNFTAKIEGQPGKEVGKMMG